MSRLMALDYGTKAIGLAITDELQITARPLATLRRDKLNTQQVIERLLNMLAEYEVSALIVGMPFNMSGTRGAATEKVERFIEKLRAVIAIPVVALDERLTSREADEILRSMGLSERERRAKSDEYAAMILLRDYLERNAAASFTTADHKEDHV